jgi:hypothetical protein
MSEDERQALLDAIHAAVGANGGTRLTRQQFTKSSQFKVGDIFRHFPSWSAALDAAGFKFDPYHQKIPPQDLFVDWAQITRAKGRIPTRNEYKLEGSYSATVYERNLGPWSSLPQVFRQFAADNAQWADLLALIPEPSPAASATVVSVPSGQSGNNPLNYSRNPRLADRTTYGDPIDFRGLRHEPVNENGVVFLFGMVARELGYLVEAVQAGFPDCEAKRQIAPGKWQRVRIEFEFESRNFREHGHPPDGCDVIVCWRHNWPECPPELEVVELESLVRELPRADE